jgi:hypothetical protein
MATSAKCKRGHEFTPENTIISQGHRLCRTCRQKSLRAFTDRNRERYRDDSEWRARKLSNNRAARKRARSRPIEDWSAFDAQIKTVESGCQEWQGQRNPDGYGWFKERQTHRLAFERANGPIPPGLLVCHSCDNPPCCNPDHLWLGTVADNTRDMLAKGRGRWKATYA